MGAGVQARLGDGDQIKIGGYELQVSVAPRSASQMPPAGAGADRMSGTPKDDPLAAIRDPWSKTPDPFADILPVSSPDSGRLEPRVPRPDPVADLQGPEPSIDDMLGGVKSGALDPLGVGAHPGRPVLSSLRRDGPSGPAGSDRGCKETDPTPDHPRP